MLWNSPKYYSDARLGCPILSSRIKRGGTPKLDTEINSLQDSCFTEHSLKTYDGSIDISIELWHQNLPWKSMTSILRLANPQIQHRNSHESQKHTRH